MVLVRVPIYKDDFADGFQDLPVLSGNGTVAETGGALVVSATAGVDMDWYTWGRHGKLPYVGVQALSNYNKIYYEFTVKSWTTTDSSHTHLVVALRQSDTVLWYLASGDGTNFWVSLNWATGIGSTTTTLPQKFRFVWDRRASTISFQYQTSSSPVAWTDMLVAQAMTIAPTALGFGIKNWSSFPACSVQYEDVEIYAEDSQQTTIEPSGMEDDLGMPQQGDVTIQRAFQDSRAGGILADGEGMEDLWQIGTARTDRAPNGTAPVDNILDKPAEGFEDTYAVRLGLVPTYNPSANDPEGHPYFLSTLGSPRLRYSFLYDATNDPWNDPVTYALNGYARDGYYYVAGAKQSQRFLDEFDNGVVDLSTDIPAGGHASESGGRLWVHLLSGEQGDWFSGVQQSPVAYTTIPATAYTNEIQEYTTRLSRRNGTGNLTVGVVLWSTRTNAYLFDINPSNVLAVSTLIGGTWTQGVATVSVADPNTTPLTLKIERHTGTALLRFMYSANNGVTWLQLYSATAGFTPTKIGMFAKNWSPYPLADGYWDYLRIGSAMAPWATEVASADRSSRPDFPIKSLLVTSQSELAIFDLDNWPTNLKVWMRFRLGNASNFYLLGRIADSLSNTRVLNGTLMVGTLNNGTENGGLFCIDFKRTGTSFALLVRADGWWNGASGRNITYRNQINNWTSQGTGFTLDSQHVHYVDAAIDNNTVSRERIWAVAGSIGASGGQMGKIRIVEIQANQPQYDYDAVGALVGPSNNFLSGLKCSFFDSAGWLWLGWGPYVFRAIADFRGGVVVMGANGGSLMERHPYAQLLHPQKSVIVRGLTQVNESIYACTNVGVYRINRFTLDAYLCYTVSGGFGGGRLNRPPAGELLGGDKEWPQGAKGFVVNRSGKPIGYLAVAIAQVNFDLSNTPANGRGAVTIIRTYDDALIDRRMYTGASSGLTEDGAWFLMPFGT